MPQRDARRLAGALLAALLLGATVFVYRGVGGHGFVNIDDPDYVTRNPAVQGGLSWGGLRWAFGNFHAANWHPLTWLSHMADADLFGADPGAQHLVSLGLHAASTLVLFELLCALTGSLWRSAAAAALFAVHPAQVEAVAWIAERKTVLAGLLGLLTVRSYLWHLARPATRPLALAAGLFAAGLLAKPMLVALPPALLLLDWWPLGRLGRGAPAPLATRRALREKTPLFALALLSGAVTIAAQSSVGAVASLQLYPLPVRVGNALTSLAAYLGELFAPSNLSAFYPYRPEALSPGRVGLAAALLAALSAAAWRARRSAPAAAFGWLWFLLTLLPVIGLVQVGSQARADRYLYLPLIGAGVAFAWGAAELARRLPRARAALALSLAAAAVLLALTAHRQAGHWQSSGTLWRHALAVDPDSETALYQLSEHEKELGRPGEQVALLERLVRLNPRHERALNNLGVARYRLGGKPEDLLADYRALLAINPKNAKALHNYGFLLIESGRAAEAVAALEQALALDPAYCSVLNNLGRAHLESGDRQRARRSFEDAVSCDPQERKYRANLSLVE